MPVRPDLVERAAIRFNAVPAVLLDFLGAAAFRAVCAAEELGVFEALAKGPVDAAGVARRTEASQHGVRLLLEALDSLGYVRTQGTSFALTGMASKWMLRSSPAGVAAAMPFFDRMVFDRWENLAESIRRGEPVLGGYEWLARHPDHWSAYEEAMLLIARLAAREIVRKSTLPRTGAAAARHRRRPWLLRDRLLSPPPGADRDNSRSRAGARERTPHRRARGHESASRRSKAICRAATSPAATTSFCLRPVAGAQLLQRSRRAHVRGRRNSRLAYGRRLLTLRTARAAQHPRIRSFQRRTVMIRKFALLVTFFALSAAARPTTLFDKYEGVRQALLKGSVPDVQRTAIAFSEAAQSEGQKAIADRARELAAVSSLKAARDSFSMLSEQMIRFRDAQSGDRPVVVYCSMEKKSWLQPRGPITNPYLDGSMRSCGEIRKDQAAPASHDHSRH